MQPRLLLNSLHLSCVTGQSLATGSYSTCEMCLANIMETLPSYLTLKINTLDTLIQSTGVTKHMSVLGIGVHQRLQSSVPRSLLHFYKLQ